MSVVTYYRQGKLFGWYYDWNQGEGTALHAHEPEMYHNLIVLRGAVFVNGEQFSAGEVINITDDRPHVVTAVRDGTRTLHLLLNGDGGFTYPDGHVVTE
jgi:redox-sensitive bicupin YhaK (pirin superfamily)